MFFNICSRCLAEKPLIVHLLITEICELLKISNFVEIC